MRKVTPLLIVQHPAIGQPGTCTLFRFMELAAFSSEKWNFTASIKSLKCRPVLGYSFWHQSCNRLGREILFPRTPNPATMKTFITLLLLLSTFAFSVQAQRNCLSVDYSRKLAAENPQVAASLRSAEDKINAYLSNGTRLLARDTSANELITIPVVVHVLYNTPSQNISDAQVLSQLQALNNDFSNVNDDRVNRPGVFKNLSADIRIKFCLAQLDPQNRRTTGIERKSTNVTTFWPDDAMKVASRGGLSAWNSKRYLNIWVCPLNNRTLGYATSPGTPVELDGVVISYDVFGTMGNLRSNFNKGRTLTHEVGHWLGLRHLWGDTDCGDDGVDDTPKQKSYNFGCPVFPRITTCSQDAFGDMFMNYMDFSDDACMNMFTQGQKKRMRACFASGNARNSMLNAYACDSNLVAGGPNPGTGGTTVNEEPKSKPYNVFPNPVSDRLTVINKSSAAGTVSMLRLYSSEGKCVRMIQMGGTRTIWSLSGLRSGLYYLTITSGDDHWVEKITVQ